MRVLRIAAVFSMLAASLHAQDSPVIAPANSRPQLETDGTYVFQHLPHSDIIFEGQIAPRIIITDSIGTAARDVLANESKSAVWGWQASATPMVRLRMFDQTSNPVRTPSYMPKGTVQVARFKNLSRATDPDSSAFNEGPIAMWLVDAIPFGHHSNGQDGCLFMDHARDADGECVAVPGFPHDVNKKDGSFSTNYIEATVHYGRIPGFGRRARWHFRDAAGVACRPGHAVQPRRIRWRLHQAGAVGSVWSDAGVDVRLHRLPRPVALRPRRSERSVSIHHRSRRRRAALHHISRGFVLPSSVGWCRSVRSLLQRAGLLQSRL